MPGEVFDSEQAAAYYDDAGVSEFYRQCWGGEDIHIGLYATGDESVGEASAAMTRHLVECAGVTDGVRILDIACGFGGTLRMLARLGCQVKGADISENCVQLARRLNAEAGLANRIEVASGDFHDIDSAPDTWDAVICQESIIHSDDRPSVFSEVFRILRPGGVFVFSDILTGENADLAMVEAAFARLGASAGATIEDYRAMACAAGFSVAHVEERAADIRTHYDKLAAALARPDLDLDANVRDAIAKSIGRWQAALAQGHITWACFVVHKPARSGKVTASGQ